MAQAPSVSHRTTAVTANELITHLDPPFPTSCSRSTAEETAPHCPQSKTSGRMARTRHLIYDLLNIHHACAGAETKPMTVIISRLMASAVH